MSKSFIKYNLVSLLLLSILVVGCAEDKKAPSSNKTKSKNRYQAPPDLFSIVTPKFQDTLHLNDTLSIHLQQTDSNQIIDSFRISLNYQKVKSTKAFNTKIKVESDKVGINVLKVEAVLKDGSIKSKQTEIYLISDIVPDNIAYKLINTYPHQDDHFTQGLVYHNEKLYEGTGQWGRSGLFQVDLKTGKSLKSLSLQPREFGEGIAILNNKIYQLTYKSMRAYVYDLESFRMEKAFNYPIYSEGWGLAADELNLYMSNGTSRLYIIEDQTFSVINQIDVTDNEGQVTMLNELEMIEGYLYANLWMSNKIAKIDPKSGIVMGYIDLTQLVPNKYKDEPSKVLNGIAYNPKTKHLYVTGKDWDKLFEISISL